MSIAVDAKSLRVCQPDSALAPAVLRVESLFKRFRRAGGSIVRAVEDVSVEVRAGEVLVLLGPSGCGKTTLLRSIAGLEHPDAGRVIIHDEVMFDAAAGIRVPTEKRRLSMIFQSYALWPHMTAFGNVSYPLRVRRRPKAEIEQRVLEVLGMVGIADLRAQYPSQMSGGQQQRVALARALVANSGLVLFDEPLSNVDARVREQLRFELAEMQQRLGFAAVYVTHDQIEALSLAHRVAVMADGQVQQVAAPRDIYEAPATRYVANFIGTTNEIRGTVTAADGDTVIVDSALGSLQAFAPIACDLGTTVTLTFRPEKCELLEVAPPDAVNTWPATVTTSMFIGSHTEYVVDVRGNLIKVWSASSTAYRHGDLCYAYIAPSTLRAFPS